MADLPIIFLGYPFSLEQTKPAVERAVAELATLIVASDRLRGKPLLHKIEEMMSEADLCLFDLTTHNANVALEIGIALAKGYQIGILFCTDESLSVQPGRESRVFSDLAGWDSILYKDTKELEDKLRAYLPEMLSNARKERNVEHTAVKEAASEVVVETVSGRVKVDEIAAEALEHYVEEFEKENLPELVLLSVGERNANVVPEGRGPELLKRPSYSRTTGFLAAYPGLETKMRGGAVIQKYGASGVTTISADGDVVLRRSVDLNLCWTQDPAAFSVCPVLSTVVLVELVLSFCFLVRDVADLTHPRRVFCVPLLTNVKNSKLRAGAPNTGDYNAPISPPNGPNETSLIGKAVISNYLNEGPSGSNPRRLAYRLLEQIYEFYGYDSSKIAFSKNNEIVFNIRPEESREERLRVVRAAIIRHFGEIQGEGVNGTTDVYVFRTKAGRIFAVTEEFLDDNEPSMIGQKLMTWNLSESVGQAPLSSRVLISNGGVDVDAS